MKIKLTTTNMLIGGGAVLALLWYRSKSQAQAAVSAASAARQAASAAGSLSGMMAAAAQQGGPPQLSPDLQNAVHNMEQYVGTDAGKTAGALNDLLHTTKSEQDVYQAVSVIRPTSLPYLANLLNQGWLLLSPDLEGYWRGVFTQAIHQRLGA